MLMINLKNHTLLYAEDETIIRLNINRFFQKNFKEVYLASNGQEALNIIDKYNPQILVLDIQMPYHSGIEIAKKVREYNQEIPIVLVTAHSDTSTLLEAIELKLTTYLIKPITQPKLETLLHKLQQHFDNLLQERVYFSDNCYWNSKHKVLYHRTQTIQLTIKEIQLLELFTKYLNKNLYYEDIMACVWEEKFNEEVSIASVKNLVSSLRKKLPKDSLKNLYGKGYILIRK